MNKANGVHVRQFRQPDVVPLRQLIHHTIDECYTTAYPPRAVQFIRDFHSDAKILERHREGEILGVEQRRKIIGTAAMVAGEIFGVFVHPEFQRKGIGSMLMRQLEARAVARGYDEAVLSVSLPSRAFYEHLGYEVTEDRSIDVGEGEILYFWQARKALNEEKLQHADGGDAE